MALVRTDYGLIYNTDGSLCATLLPEGGVAVTEGTTNLIPSDRLKFEGWTAYQGASVTIEQGYGIPDITPDGATRIQTSGGTSVTKYLFGVGTGAAGTPASYRVWIRNIGNVPVQVYGNAIPVSNIVYPGEIKLCVGSTNAVNGTAHRQILLRALDVNDSLDFIAYQPQIEEKPYPTPFVDGTRPAGSLSYPVKLGRQGTIAFKWMKFKTLSEGYEMPFRVANNIFEANIRDGLLSVGHYTGPINSNINWEPFKEYFFVYAWDMDSTETKQWLYHNGELVATRQSAPSDPTTYDTLWVGCGGKGSHPFNGVLKNFLVLPYAVSPETVATWHSLDTPFFDPREQIDAGATPIHMYSGEIDGYGHTVYDGYGNKAVFSGIDPDTGDRGYKVYDNDGSEVTFLGVRADGKRGLMLQEGDTTWLDPDGISGSKVMSLPWTSLDSATQLLFSEFFTGNFIMADENGEYGFDFGNGSAQIRSYIFKATEDAYVNSLQYTAYDVVYSWRNVNYGSETRLRIANDVEYNYTVGRTYYDKYAYIKFSGLSSIPASEEIVDAELRLYFTNLSATRFALTVPTATWSETTITWNNQPGIAYSGATFDARLGTTIVKSSLVSLLNVIRANRVENRGFRIQALDESKGESVLYSREGHSTLCPTLIVYTRETQSPVPGLNLHIPGGRVFLNRKIFDVPGKTLTLDANRNDITLYVYENEDGEAVIDFAHGSRAFKAESYVVLGSATTSSSAITGVSKKRNSGRKEGPRGMGNDIYTFGYTSNDGGVISISTQTRTPFREHALGGSKYHVILEIRPTSGGTWQKFYPTIDASGSRGITVEIDSSKIQFIAGSDSVYRYLKSDGTMTELTSAQIRGIIIRLD